ncbi:MAG: hypothetical protein JKY57_06080, partial [Kordiimonadaceae bacterium]|nr:hypothetical protein [Kordiimonadaceae bacterium]
ALKMAIAYHRVRGEGHRTRLIGREKGYHGVNFGGMAVGGMPANRKCLARWLRVLTICATHTVLKAIHIPKASQKMAPNTPMI